MVCTKKPTDTNNVAKVSSSPIQSKFDSPGRHNIGGQTGGGANRLHIEAFEGGILLGYFDNGASSLISAFNRPHFVKLVNDESLRQTINVDGIAFRRGVDGETFMPGRPNVTWGWQVLISIIGSINTNNSEFKTRQFITPVLRYFNNFTDVQEEYTFRRVTRFYVDHTPTDGPPRKISTALLDNKVIDLIITAHSDNAGDIDLNALADNNDLVSIYWEDIEYGKDKMRLAHVARQNMF